MAAKSKSDSAVEHAKSILLPSSLGREVLPDILGVPFELAPHLAHIEQQILPEILDTSRRSFISVSAPPRHGKSIYAQLVAAWFLMMFPNRRVIYVTYGDDLSRTAGKLVLQIVKRHGPRLFGVNTAATTPVLDWNMEGSPLSGMLSVGIGSGITGRGGDCFPAGTLVSTPGGSVRIERLAQSGGTVWTHDEATGQIQEGEVVAGRVIRSRPLVEVVFASGRTLRCTPDHRIWIEGRGWIEARLVEGGTKVRTVGDAGLRRLRGQLPEAGLRGGESHQEREEGVVLLADVRGAAVQDHAPLRNMRRSDREEDVEVLFTRLPVGGQGHDDRLPEVRRGGAGEVEPADLLLSGLCELGALGSDDRERELEPSEGNEPLEVVLRDAATDHGAGRGVRCLPDEGGAVVSCASHRRGPAEQSAGESRLALSGGSHQAPQVEFDTVALVRPVCGGGVEVYDIEVEGTRCFFAEEVLVHNCIIIDDVLKNAEEARSAASKKAQVEEYDATIRTRLEPGGTILMIATRWAGDDLPGTIRERAAAPEYTGDPWKFIDFPALAEVPEEEVERVFAEHDQEEAEATLEAWRDQIGRVQGEALWPNRAAVDELHRIRSSVDPATWSSLFQQNPTIKAGGMFPKESWSFYGEGEEISTEAMKGSITKRCWVWDTAFTKAGGDWTVGILLGVRQDRTIALLEHVRIQEAADGVEAAIVNAAKRTGPTVPVLLEQERAGSGKFLVQQFQRKLVGWIVEGVKPEGEKEERAGFLSSIQRQGGFWLPAGQDFLKAWVNEFKFFPRGKHDDQVDAAVHGANYLLEAGQVSAWSPAELGNVGSFEDMVFRLQQAGIWIQAA